jgi:hypothetical protein
MYFTCDHPATFLPEVTAALTAFENQMIDEQPDLEAVASTLWATGMPDQARRMLTDYSHSHAQDALALGQALLGSIEARTRLLYGLREPTTDEVSRLDYQMVTCRPPE